ncbi:MAG: hypothetical protein Q9159_004702 [Coniocarpon cinnabarinum]
MNTSNLINLNQRFGDVNDCVNVAISHLCGGLDIEVETQYSSSLISQIAEIKAQMKSQVDSGFHLRWFDPDKYCSDLEPMQPALGICSANRRRPYDRPPCPSVHRHRWLTKTSFTTAEEYLLAALLGLCIDHELDMAEASELDGVLAQFFRIKDDSSRRRFIMQLPHRRDRDEDESNVTVRKDDTFSLHYEDLPPIHCKVSRARVEEYADFLEGYIDVERDDGPYDTALLEDNFTVLPAESFSAVSNDLRRGLDVKNCARVKIQLKRSETTFKFQYSGLMRWQNLVSLGNQAAQEKCGIVLGNSIAHLPRRDLLGGLEGAEADLETYRAQVVDALSLNQEQKDALALFRNAPGGVCVVDGCAGSGKSHLIRCVALIHMFKKNAARIDETNQYSQILIPGATNFSCNAIAYNFRFYSQLARKALSLDQDPIIIRAYKITIETVLIRHARKVFEKVCVDSTLVDLVTKYTKKKPAKFYDIRPPQKVKIQKEMSVGWVMANYLGIANGIKLPPKQKSSEWYSQLRNTLVGYHSLKIDNNYESTKLDKFKDNLMELLQEVLATAHVLILTTTQALDSAYFQNYKADIMIVDEAGQVSDVEFAALQACYPRVDRYVSAGDCRQHGVFSKDRTGNPMKAQRKKPVHQRLQQLGYPTARLLQQHRLTYDIARLSSEVHYRGEIRGNPDTRERKWSLQVRHFNHEHFATDTNVVFVDVHDTHCDKFRRSRRNAKLSEVAIKLIQKLSKKFSPSSILLVSPYAGQRTSHNMKLEELAKKDTHFAGDEPNLSNIQTETLDSVQGGESLICIVDLTVNDDIGFLAESARTLVGCSRPSDGLYILGDVAKLKLVKNYDSEPLGCLVQHCIDNGYVQEWREV